MGEVPVRGIKKSKKNLLILETWLPLLTLLGKNSENAWEA